MIARVKRAVLLTAGAIAWAAVVARDASPPRQARLPAPAPAAPASWRRLLKLAAHGWSADEVTRLAAALSYYTVFSIAPLLLIVIALAEIFWGDDAAQGIVSRQLTNFIGADKAHAIESMISAIRRANAAKAAGLLGTATLILGASAVVRELQGSLNKIFGFKPATGGYWRLIKRRLVSLAFVLGMGLLLLASLGASAGVAAAGKYFAQSLRFPELVLQAINQSVSLGVITSIFASMFRFLPDARLSWRDVIVGAAFTAVLLTVGNLALASYLGKRSPASAYGAAGSLLALLLWTYYCAQIFYFGAEFTKAYALNRGRGIQR